MAPAAALFCSLRERWNELFIFKANFLPAAATEPQPFVSDAWNNAGGLAGSRWVCLCESSRNPGSPSAGKKARWEHSHGLSPSAGSGGDVGDFLRALNSRAASLRPRWHPAPAGDICRKAGRSCTNHRSPRAGCRGAGPVPMSPRAFLSPPRAQPCLLFVSRSTAALWEAWGASPAWGERAVPGF